MNASQLLQQIKTNRGLIARNNKHAYEHLQMLINDYAHIANDEVRLSLALSSSLAELHFNSNYSAAIENSLAAVDKFKDSGFSDLLALHLKTIGYSFAHLGEFDLAEQNLLEALRVITPEAEDFFSIKADILHTLAMNEDIKDEGAEKGIQYLTEAIELLKGTNHELMLANCQMGLGNMYNSARNPEEALKNYLIAAEAFEHNYALRSMASVYSNIGNCYTVLKDLDLAEKYLEKSLDLRMQFGSPDDISISYFNLAIVYKDKNLLDKSTEFLNKSKVILEQIGNKPFIKMVNQMLDDLDLMKAVASA
jgi:tetratricopeptide (TPR) repeat protein